MRAVTQLLHSEWVRNGLGWIGAQYIKLVWASGRWRSIGASIPAGYWDAGQPFILAFWHGRLLMMPYCWPGGKPMNMLISKHRDGDFIAQIISYFGLGVLRGSSAKSGKHDKGGGGAFRAMLRLLGRGEYAGITPDGPRGPRMRAGDGIIALARLSGAPVIPVSYATVFRIHARSWDRFLIALPFSRGVFIWGEPINVPRDADAQMIEHVRRTIEDSLNRITAEADVMCGHAPVEPAPELS